MQSLCCEITVIAGQHVEHIFLQYVPSIYWLYRYMQLLNVSANKFLAKIKICMRQKKPNRVNKNQATDDDTKAKATQKMLN